MSDNRPIPDTIEVPGEKWDEIVGMLKALEWVGSLAEQFRSDVCCPECFEPKNKGKHLADCRLAKLLGELP